MVADGLGVWWLGRAPHVTSPCIVTGTCPRVLCDPGSSNEAMKHLSC
ncbi:rCG53886, partial [Rattus norvegicus]